ncbi:MAG: ABC transporter substrate-binding protein [Alphaproteobacteria bacterium]
MTPLRIAFAAALAAAAAAPAGADELRIGFLNTTTGQGAFIGKFLENGWKLGLEHAGWAKDGDRLGGVPTRIFYGDDQSRPDVGIREVDKMIKSDKVHLIAGQLWSHVLMATQKPIFDAKVMLISTNAGPSPLAGELCNPLFVAAGAQNDLVAEATGELVNRDGVKTVMGLAPNYQAGKDYLGGFERAYKGRMIDKVMFKVAETDYQAEFAQVRARKPEAIVIFAPGAMGVAFMKQWQASGLRDQVKLYSIFSIDYMTLPVIGEAAVGAVEASYWNPENPLPANRRFVKDYLAKFGHMPSFPSAANYDAVGMIARAMQATKGNTGDMAAVARQMRTTAQETIRGNLRFNVNGFFIQPYWETKVVAGPDGKPTIKGGSVIFERADSFTDKCPADKRT